MADNRQDGYQRLPLLAPQDLNREQQDVYDRIAGTMLPWTQESGFQGATEDGRLLGPFNALLYNPELGMRQLDFIATERASTGLDATVREVVILTVGAACKSDYELYAHRAVAAKAGLAAENIEALATGSEPKSLKPDEATAHRFVKALVVEHRVPDDLFHEALKAFGHRCLVDMVHLAGLYLAVSSMLNAFAVAVPESGSKP